jgi:hypothetical protein
MAEWPDATELAQVLDISNVGDWSTTLDRVLAASIIQVKKLVRDWDEYEDEPDESLSQAALRLAELMVQRPELTAAENAKDPAFTALIFGHRRGFSIG